MQPIGHTFQTLYSELAQRALDARFATDFPADGRFVSVAVKERKYWYFDTPPADKGPRQKRVYVGPADDDEISKRVEAFKDLKADVRARRKIVATLTREAYLPQPDPTAGAIVQALADAGFFRLRGVLVGTVAFHVYPALLGVRFANAAMQTADADFAQFRSISAAIGDGLPPMLDVLKAVDPTFREIADQTDGRHITQYAARSGYKVEFLTPNTGSDDNAGRPASMPAPGGASAQPLRFLDFLIHQPQRAVLLHGAGIPILAPTPERYAIHKLIVGSRRFADRDGTAKSAKDRAQAQMLMDAMFELRRGDAVAEAYMEAWDRGPSWRDAIRDSMAAFDDDIAKRFGESLSNAIGNLGEDAKAYGFERT